jgi:hypothetical protein
MTPRPSGKETSDALAAVLDDQSERKQRREAPPEPRDRKRKANRVAILVVLLALWMVIAPPSVLLPPPIPAPTAVDVQNGLHMDIYVAAAQVVGYRAENGRLPERLIDALAESGAAADLVYTVRPDGNFEIRGERAGERVVYVSTESLREFRASARAAIEAGS